MKAISLIIQAFLLALVLPTANGFVASSSKLCGWTSKSAPTRPVVALSSSGSDIPESTLTRLQELVDTYPVLLFMKGSKLFPQCGFSNTAVQILNTYGINYHTVDVLSDEEIRQGVKVFSQWPTIPQLYVAGEFIGGSDIMIEMYQNGELGEMIEKAKADMV